MTVSRCQVAKQTALPSPVSLPWLGKLPHAILRNLDEWCCKERVYLRVKKHKPPKSGGFLFPLTFVPFECADFQAFLHSPESWLHLRFLCDHVSPGASVLRKTTNLVWVIRAGAWCCLKSLPSEIGINFHMNKDKPLLRAWWGVQDTGLCILFHPALSFME